MLNLNKSEDVFQWFVRNFIFLLVFVNGTHDGPRGTKRSADSDDEPSYQPPVNDIYRSRQQKRVHPL